MMSGSGGLEGVGSGMWGRMGLVGVGWGAWVSEENGGMGGVGVCEGVPMAKAFQWPRHVWQQGGTCAATLERTQAITAGERASKHGGWWERGLGQGLSAFLGMFN